MEEKQPRLRNRRSLSLNLPCSHLFLSSFSEALETCSPGPSGRAKGRGTASDPRLRELSLLPRLGVPGRWKAQLKDVFIDLIQS